MNTDEREMSLIERAVKRHGPHAVLKELSDEQKEQLPWQWQFWARPKQLAPTWVWLVWLILAGRGFGKTRVGAEQCRIWVRDYPMVNLIGATVDDARDIMVDGESGILARCPPDERPVYRKSERCLLWPNGAKSLIFTADEPDRLRGKQHMKVWADEIAAWRYEESWDQMLLGLRLGDAPQVIATTTPRPTAFIRSLIAESTTHVTRGSTHENRKNLSPVFYSTVLKKYEGTRLGRQEISAEILEDTPGAIWTQKNIDELRVKHAPDLIRVVVGVDPSGGRGERGIVVDGVGWCTCKGPRELHGFTLLDVSGEYTADTWGRVAVNAYRDTKADRIVVEKNYGGDMAKALIHTVDDSVPVEEVTATRGKAIRAEPVAALYEQGKWHHVGHHPKLETQQTTWTPESTEGSPDRMDAHVWAATDLMLDGQSSSKYIAALQKWRSSK